MDPQKFLAERFEADRARLRGVAYRMLGSAGEADDAVQEAWLRLSRAGSDGIENLGGWLTTVVARVCLDTLRSRRSRREEPLGAPGPEPSGGIDPEQEAQLADSVGLALLVVLEALTPAERVAFVMHDMFDLPFEEIAPIVGRSPTAARQLASRARRRVRGAATPGAGIARQREIAAAYLAAARTGDFNALLALLDPEAVLHADLAPSETRGAAQVARRALDAAQGAVFARLALVEGTVGLVAAPRGRLVAALRFILANDKIADIDIVTDPARLRALQLAVIGD